MLRQLCALARLHAILCLLATGVHLHKHWQRWPPQLLHSIIQLIGQLHARESTFTAKSESFCTITWAADACLLSIVTADVLVGALKTVSSFKADTFSVSTVSTSPRFGTLSVDMDTNWSVTRHADWRISQHSLPLKPYKPFSTVYVKS